MDFELVRADPTAALGPRDLRKGGRPAFHPVLTFRMLGLATPRSQFAGTPVRALAGLSLAERGIWWPTV